MDANPTGAAAVYPVIGLLATAAAVGTRCETPDAEAALLAPFGDAPHRSAAELNPPSASIYPA